MRDYWYEVVQERDHATQPLFEKINELILQTQHAQGSSPEREELRAVIRELRAIQDKAAEDIKTVPVANLPSQVNTAVSGTVVGPINLTIRSDE